MSAQTFMRAARVDFGPEPANYVPGVGRGAVGFSTRSDLGESAAAAVEESVPLGRGRNKSLAQARAMSAAAAAGGGSMDTEPVYDQEDENAEQVYAAVDRRVGGKRGQSRTSVEQDSNLSKRRRKVFHEFAEAKRQLARVSAEEWASIPEVVDQSRSNKQEKKWEDRYTPVPDRVIRQALERSTDWKGKQDLLSVGMARDKLLGIALDGHEVEENVGENVDEYLAQLLERSSSQSVVNDVKARKLYQSMVQTSPGHGLGWVAYAQLEESQGRIREAQAVISEACLRCPGCEEVWVYALHLFQGTARNAVLSKALKSLPLSEKLWVLALEAENHSRGKRAVVRKALGYLPKSERLWRAAIGLEDKVSEDFRLLLRKAVEQVPGCVDWWVMLASVEEYAKAKRVLNKALGHHPVSKDLWVAAARLEEGQGNLSGVSKVLGKYFSELCVGADSDISHAVGDTVISHAVGDTVISHAVGDTVISHAVTDDDISRIVTDNDISHNATDNDISHTVSDNDNDTPHNSTTESKHNDSTNSNLSQEWMDIAERAERQGYLETCKVIVGHLFQMGAADKENKDIWIQRVDRAIGQGFISTARSMLYNLADFDPTMWARVLRFEHQHGSANSVQQVLEQSLSRGGEQPWLAQSRYLYDQGDIDGCKTLLEKACVSLPNSVQVWKSAAQLQLNQERREQALFILEQAREQCKTSSEELWIMSALLLKQTDKAKATDLLSRAKQLFPNSAEIVLSLAHLCKDPITLLKEACKALPHHAQLWENYALLQSSPAQTRAVLESGRKHCKDPRLYIRSVELEQSLGNVKDAYRICSAALTALPGCGELWAKAVELEAPSRQRVRSVDALKACGDNVHVFLVVSRLFVRERKTATALKWMEKALGLSGLDEETKAMVYAHRYQLQKLFGSQECAQKVLDEYCSEVSQSFSGVPPSHQELSKRVLEHAEKLVFFENLYEHPVN